MHVGYPLTINSAKAGYVWLLISCKVRGVWFEFQSSRKHVPPGQQFTAYSFVILHSYSTFISRFLCRAIRLLYVMQIKKRRVCKPLPCFADNEDETVADAVDCRDYRAEGNELAEAGNMEVCVKIFTRYKKAK